MGGNLFGNTRYCNAYYTSFTKNIKRNTLSDRLTKKQMPDTLHKNSLHLPLGRHCRQRKKYLVKKHHNYPDSP